MPIEIELKFRDVDHAAVRGALQALNARPCGRVFERNEVFDDPARSLAARDMLLRLRQSGDQWTLTLKRPVAAQGGETCIKRREEIETRVTDGAAIRETLQALGYDVAFRYEKRRETWRAGSAEVCLDVLPFGDFLEIEGEEAEIEDLARRLGLEPADSTVKTYHALNVERQLAQGVAQPDENFVFPRDG